MTPKIEMSANRFELINEWGDPLDKAWARDMFERWLEQRTDLTGVYDSSKQAKVEQHD